MIVRFLFNLYLRYRRGGSHYSFANTVLSIPPFTVMVDIFLDDIANVHSDRFHQRRQRLSLLQ